MSGPCEPSAGIAVNAKAEPSGEYAAVESITSMSRAISMDSSPLVSTGDASGGVGSCEGPAESSGDAAVGDDSAGSTDADRVGRSVGAAASPDRTTMLEPSSVYPTTISWPSPDS